MKLFLALFLVCCTKLVSVAEGTGFKYTITTEIRTAYVGRVGINFQNVPTSISDLTVAYGDWYLNTWNATRLDNGDGQSYRNSFGNEWDVTLGWNHSFEYIYIDVHYSQFILADFAQLDDDLGVVDVTLSLPKVPFVEPFLTVRNFVETGHDSPEGGWFTWVGVKRNQHLGFSVGNRPILLNLEAGTAFSDGALRRDPGHILWRFVAGLPIPVSDSFTITPSVVVMTPTADQKHTSRPFIAETEIIGGLKVTCGF